MRILLIIGFRNVPWQPCTQPTSLILSGSRSPKVVMYVSWNNAWMLIERLLPFLRYSPSGAILLPKRASVFVSVSMPPSQVCVPAFVRTMALLIYTTHDSSEWERKETVNYLIIHLLIRRKMVGKKLQNLQKSIIIIIIIHDKWARMIHSVNRLSKAVLGDSVSMEPWCVFFT